VDAQLLDDADTELDRIRADILVGRFGGPAGPG
jgi:hypothetical protein